MKILTRKEINIISSTIRALAYRDISFMEGLDDEAIYEVDLVNQIGSSHLRHRAQHILQMVEMMPYQSIESRNLWQYQHSFRQEVFDLLFKIDREVNRITKEEKRIEEIHIQAKEDSRTVLTEVQQIELLDTIKLDGRWNENTIPNNIRARYPEITLDDETILDIVLPEDIVYYEDPNSISNIEYVEMLKARRNGQ